jgi:hypothetical protein
MKIRHLYRNEEGATLAVAAVMIAGVTSMLALSVDLGMLWVARAEAQKAADAAALAGAQEFLYVQLPAAAVTPAHDAAMAFARQNAIRNVLIDSAEVTIQVIPADQKVWVRIERTGLSLWFARLLGRPIGTVNAAAAAAAMPAGAADCLAPFAVPDAWGEADPTEDVDADRVWDTGEQWTYGDDALDSYLVYTSNSPSGPVETGYGSAYRNTPWGGGSGIVDDYGRPMFLKMQDPANAPVSGFFYPFRIGTNSGASDYRFSIENCDPQVVPLGAPVPLEMGNMKGPTRQGVENLVALDPGATWVAGYGITNSTYGNGLNSASPRIKTVPLYDPGYINQVMGGNHNLTFNNFAKIFLEGVVAQGPDEFVVGRFMYYARGLGGSSTGGTTGSLVRVLQLVE